MYKAIDKWLPGYMKSVLTRPGFFSSPSEHRPVHILLCIADHFEPFRGNASETEACAIVRRWHSNLASAVEGITDSDGVPPQHTFFYPQEEYNPDCLNMLADLAAAGYGETEIHLHHRNDTEAGLREKLITFRDTLHNNHGLLGHCKETTDCEAPYGCHNPVQPPFPESSLTTRFAFIHGNWALCNSRPDGDWCGVNNELSILSEAGCYADFTFPSAPSPTQPKTVNSIYRASDLGNSPRSHDYGISVRADSIPENTDSSLMLVEGPLSLDWSNRKYGLFPRLENSEISAVNPASSARMRQWTRQHIHVRGRSDWVFVKLHTHGCVKQAADLFLFADAPGSMRQFHVAALEQYNNEHCRLHYVTAREMYNIIRAAEDGKAGDPGQYRNYEVLAPPCRGEWDVGRGEE